MRIVFVVHTFFPDWRAGTEVYAKSLARKVIEHGHEAFVVCYEPPAGDDSFQGIRAWDTVWEEIPVRRISFCKRNRYFDVRDYLHQQAEEQLFEYLSGIRPDIVHVVHAMHLTTASIWAAKRLGLPVVSTATDFWYVCPTYQLVRWDESLCQGPHPLTCLACLTGDASGIRLRRLAAHKQLARVISPLLIRLGAARLFRPNWMPGLLWLSERRSWMQKTLSLVDVLLAPTANTARLIQLNGLNPAEMRISGFGLEGHIRRDGETRPVGSILRVGYVGTFRHSKGLHVLLEAMRSLPADKVHLDIYGSPGYFPDYDRMIHRLGQGLPNVSFQGTFANEKLPEIFAGFDVVVIPSLWYENSPLVLLSAFALKTPVVASNVGSFADLIEHDKSGLLFEMGSAGDLARQLQKLVERPEEVNRLRAGIPEVRTIDENLGELLEIYEQLARNGDRTKRAVERPSLLPSVALRWGSLKRFVSTRAARVKFADSLTLLGCRVDASRARELSFDFRWHARAIAPDWVVFIHLLDENGETQIWGDHKMVQYDQDPWGFISYRLNIYTEEHHSGRSYRVRLGVWSPESKTRLHVRRSRGLEIDTPENAVSLGTVQMG